jgi:hypothetical protein
MRYLRLLQALSHLLVQPLKLQVHHASVTDAMACSADPRDPRHWMRAASDEYVTLVLQRPASKTHRAIIALAGCQ